MKLTRIAMLGGAISALLLSATSALADTAPTVGNTTGTAGGGAGNASIFNIADLKTNAAGQLIPGNYDDDLGNTDNHFVVVPNLDDNPLQMAMKFVFINNPAGVLQVEKTISSVNADGSFTIVFHDARPGTEIKTSQACLDLLGADATAPSVANGLITTGQKSAAELQSVRNGCQENHTGILTNPFPVSKHLPPGIYRQCAVLAQTGGSASPTYCEYFKILPITGFVTDVNSVNYGNLVQFVKSIFAGNWTMDTGTSNPGTISGTGNTSPKLLVAYTCMSNDYNVTPNDTSDDKLICRYFDVQLNRQDINGNIIATNHIDNITGGTGTNPNAFGADADLTTGVSTGVAPFTPICLEPNENLKLDFSVTPQEPLYPGTYSGKVRLTVTNTGLPTSCTPTLGNGESANGDANSVNNNLPGTLVAQTYPGN